MDAANELSQFLTSRRAKVTPEQAGLPSYGRRRVSGLRREEVASLAGVSVEYYKRLERGNASGASDSVLEALADALRLDDAERAHLFDLARAASPIAPRRRRASDPAARPAGGTAASSTASTAPATVSNMRCDYLAANQLGRALYAPLFESREQPPNSARFTFLDPAAQGRAVVGWAARARSKRCARSASSSWSAPASALEHALGDAAEVAALEAGVVLDAHAGQDRDLLAAQSRERGEARTRSIDLVGGDPGPAGGEELPDLLFRVHAQSVDWLAASGRPCQYPYQQGLSLHAIPCFLGPSETLRPHTGHRERPHSSGSTSLFPIRQERSDT